MKQTATAETFYREALPSSDYQVSGPSDAAPSVSLSPVQLTIWALIGTIGMLFAGFASAYLVRREGLDWVEFRLPGILWANTVVLLASSAALELARRAHRRGHWEAMQGWVTAGMALGLVFLVGQYSAWRNLESQGLYLQSNPYSSFFYVLTALHAAHLLGGLIALTYLFARITPANDKKVSRATLDGCVTYWHFLDGLWVLLFLLLRS